MQLGLAPRGVVDHDVFGQFRPDWLELFIQFRDGRRAPGEIFVQTFRQAVQPGNQSAVAPLNRFQPCGLQ